jgi:hypothetical protein
MKAFAYVNVSDPWIAWLAYRGEMIAASHITPQAVGIWLAKYLIDAGKAGRRVQRFRTLFHRPYFVSYRLTAFTVERNRVRNAQRKES